MNITDISQVSFCSSEVILRIDLNDFAPEFVPDIKTIIANVTLETFDINELSEEVNKNTYLLKKQRVSNKDTYVSFEIQDYLKNDLIRKEIQNNVDFPVLMYQNTAMPFSQGLCLFYRVVYSVTDGTTTITLPSPIERVATLGWRWNTEEAPFYGSFVGDANGFNVARDVVKTYVHDVPYYAEQSFNFELGTGINSNNFITTTKVEPTNPTCAKEPVLIIYLNRIGLFEYITFTGKTVIDVDTKRTEQPKSFRDQAMINASTTHFEHSEVIEAIQSYTVNTGVLDESMNALIEELLYSPKVYLIRFYGSKYTVAQVGITVDNDIITVDNTNITVDSDTITNDDVGYYSTSQQVPVTVVDSNFVKRTNNNDKRDISYFVKFKETNSKVK